MIIDRFKDEYAFLSNFYPSTVEYDGVEYTTVEHAYQAAKSSSQIERLKIKLAKHPGEAKRLGQKIQLQENWDNIKYDIMLDLVRQKFNANKNPELAKMLLGTGEVKLVESNHWNDTIWGVCNGKGKNWLGEILMQVRKEIA